MTNLCFGDKSDIDDGFLVGIKWTLSMISARLVSLLLFLVIIYLFRTGVLVKLRKSTGLIFK